MPPRSLSNFRSSERAAERARKERTQYTRITVFNNEIPVETTIRRSTSPEHIHRHNSRVRAIRQRAARRSASRQHQAVSETEKLYNQEMEGKTSTEMGPSKKRGRSQTPTDEITGGSSAAQSFDLLQGGGSSAARPASYSLFGTQPRKFGDSNKVRRGLSLDANKFHSEVKKESPSGGSPSETKPGVQAKKESSESSPNSVPSSIPQASSVGAFDTTNSFINIKTESPSDSSSFPNPGANFEFPSVDPELDEEEEDEESRLINENQQLQMLLRKQDGVMKKREEELKSKIAELNHADQVLTNTYREREQLENDNQDLIKQNDHQGTIISDLQKARIEDDAAKKKFETLRRRFENDQGNNQQEQETLKRELHEARQKYINSEINLEKKQKELENVLSGSSDDLVLSVRNMARLQIVKLETDQNQLSTQLKSEQAAKAQAVQDSIAIKQESINIEYQRDRLKKEVQQLEQTKTNLVNKVTQFRQAAGVHHTDLKQPPPIVIIKEDQMIHGLPAEARKLLEGGHGFAQRYKMINQADFSASCPDYTWNLNKPPLERVSQFFTWINSLGTAVNQKFGIEFSSFIKNCLNCALTNAQWYWDLSQTDAGLYRGTDEICKINDAMSFMVHTKVLAVLPEALGINYKLKWQKDSFDEFDMPLHLGYHSIPGLFMWMLIHYILPSGSMQELGGVQTKIIDVLCKQVSMPVLRGQHYHDEVLQWFSQLKLVSRLFSCVRGLSRERIFEIFECLHNNARKYGEGHHVVRDSVQQMKNIMIGPVLYSDVVGDIKNLEDIMLRHRAVVGARSWDGTFTVPYELKISDTVKKAVEHALARQAHLISERISHDPPEAPPTVNVRQTQGVPGGGIKNANYRYSTHCPKFPITDSQLFKKYADPTQPTQSHAVITITKAWAKYCPEFEAGKCPRGTSCHLAHVRLVALNDKVQEPQKTVDHFCKVCNKNPTEVVHDVAGGKSDLFQCWSTGMFGHRYFDACCRGQCGLDEAIMCKKKKGKQLFRNGGKKPEDE